MDADHRPPRSHAAIAVAAGGAIGAVLRWMFSETFPRGQGEFPWATFAENVIGALLLGIVATLILPRVRVGRYTQPFLCVGVFGSFTTFSNFSVESLDLARGDRPWLAMAYSSTSVVAGLAAAVLGFVIARAIVRHLDGRKWIP